MAHVNLKRLFAAEGPKVGHAIFEFDSPGIGQIIAASTVAAAMMVKCGAVPDHLVEPGVAENATFLERLANHRKAFG